MTIQVLLIMDVVALSDDQKKAIGEKGIAFELIARKASRMLIDILIDQDNVAWLRNHIKDYNVDVIRVRKFDGDSLDETTYPTSKAKYDAIMASVPEHQYMGWLIPSQAKPIVIDPGPK